MGEENIKKLAEKLTPEDGQFIQYLQNTLIPDLQQMGRDETAKDFDELIRILDRLLDVTP